LGLFLTLNFRSGLIINLVSLKHDNADDKKILNLAECTRSSAFLCFGTIVANIDKQMKFGKVNNISEGMIKIVKTQ